MAGPGFAFPTELKQQNKSETSGIKEEEKKEVVVFNPGNQKTANNVKVWNEETKDKTEVIRLG